MNSRFVLFTLLVALLFTAACRPSARKYIPIDPEMVSWQETNDLSVVEDALKDIYFGDKSAGVLIVMKMNDSESDKTWDWWEGKASPLPGTAYSRIFEKTVGAPHPVLDEIFKKLLPDIIDPRMREIVQTRRPMCLLTYVDEKSRTLTLTILIGKEACTQDLYNTLHKMQQNPPPE